MTPDRRWPLLVSITERHILWHPGDSAEDAAARLRRRDPIVIHEEACGETCVGGGTEVEEVPDYYDPYEYNEQYGPRLPDGGFYGPGAVRFWRERKAEAAAQIAAAVLPGAGS